MPNGGSCLLGSINLSAYVKEEKFDIDTFRKDINVIVKAMNEVLDQGLPLHPLQIQRETVRDYRQIGIGIMGIADMLIKMGVRYDSEEAIKICEAIGFELINNSIKASALLAKEQGAYPKYNKEAILQSEFLKQNTTDEVKKLVEEYGLRNSQLLTIAPCGTISTMIGVSGGIEPIFSLSYMRKTESLHGEEVFYKVFTPIAKEYMEKHGIENEEDLPDYFVTTANLNPFMRVQMQGVWQKHIDASISSTINLPNEATVEQVEQLYLEAWKNGLKGLTIYRSGCAREGILVTDKKEEVVEEVKQLQRGEWKSLADDTYYIKRNLVIGCGKLKLFVGYSPSEQAIQDVYITKCGSGGCEKNLQCIAILMSALLRTGASLEMIEKAFSGVSACPSFTRERGKGKHLSDGSYCGMAILKEMKLVLKQLNKDVEVPKKQERVEVKEEQPKGSVCPECKQPSLVRTNGCNACTNCGYSKCD